MNIGPSDSDYVKMEDRPEWEDITPISQDDGPNPVAPIAYPFEYTDTMNYFRALSKKEEISERAYQLTEQVIDFNPSHYTVWLYRQRIIKELNFDLKEELEFIEEMVENNPKCYQLWQHRQFIVDLYNSNEFENEFLSKVLQDDSKNFHAWSYKQWLIRRFNLWDKELPIVEELIDSDLRNNSAWNQRYYVLTQHPNNKLNLDLEIQYTLDKIEKLPYNECPFNYLKGILIFHFGKETYFSKLNEIIEQLLEKKVKSKHLIAWQVEVYQSLAKYDQHYKDKAKEACEKLISSDFIRVNYWKYRLNQILSL